MSLKRWHSIDDILLPLAVLTMRLCWLWPWLELLRRWITPYTPISYLPLPTLIVLGIGGYVTARQVLSGESITRLARGVVITLGLAAVAIALWLHYVGGLYALWDIRGFQLLANRATDWSLGPPPAFMGMMVGVLLWVQGVRDANPLSRHEQIWTTFTVGFLAFVAMLLLVQLDDRGAPPGTGAAVWVFFGVGLAALALSALEYAGLGQGKSGAIPGISRYWLGSMLAVVGGILGIGFLLILVIAPGTIAAILGSLRFLLNWLGTILGFIFVVISYLLFLIIEPIFNWIQERMELPEPEEDTIDDQSLEQMMDEYWAEPANVLPQAVTDSLPWVALLLTGLGLVIAVTIALRLMRRKPEESYVETRESVFSADLLQEQLSSLWQRLRGTGDDTGHAPFVSLAGEEDRRRAVRAIYQEFLARMQAAGHPRPRQQTPAAYGKRLQAAYAFAGSLHAVSDTTTPDEIADEIAEEKGHNQEGDTYPEETARQTSEQTTAQQGLAENKAVEQPTTQAVNGGVGATTPEHIAEHAADIDTLTAGYIHARYGDTAPTDAEVDAVRQAWQRLRALLGPEPTDEDGQAASEATSEDNTGEEKTSKENTGKENTDKESTRAENTRETKSTHD